ncbi:MAG: hypothetical protein KDA05_03010, partial [Phycisphaerales bacterium]|nr:hypothetical protein [Phycisphaerales bacterium]
AQRGGAGATPKANRRKPARSRKNAPRNGRSGRGAAGQRTARRRATSLTELKAIESSKAWRAIERVRSSLPYAAYARLRFGRSWRDAAHAARSLPPEQRLAHLKQSGAYRFLLSVKTSPVYRVLRKPRVAQ